jgi:hypothetical protein
MEAVEQSRAQPLFERFHLLAYSAGGDVQLVRSELETEMPRGGLKCPEGVEGRKHVSHRNADSPSVLRALCNRFSTSVNAQSWFAGRARPAYRARDFHCDFQ